ncbi:MAG TPA: hypothetical protein VHK69_00715 [Chitinophagaceae bacterium]|jgi:hypothetical protein|nr:hypothetical protein [Chitinophagaceae bacterium]
MNANRILNVIYYLNNTVFSFLLLYMVVAVVHGVLLLLKAFGVVPGDISPATSIYNAVSDMVTKGLLLVALYQSFMALSDLKHKAGNAHRYSKHFRKSGFLFCIASMTHLLDMGAIHSGANRINKVYTSTDFYVAVNSSSLLLFAIGVLLLFVSALTQESGQLRGA